MTTTSTEIFVRFINHDNDPNAYSGSGKVVRVCSELGYENFVEVQWDDGVVSYHPVDVLESY